jgi:hypothetical protein
VKARAGTVALTVAITASLSARNAFAATYTVDRSDDAARSASE